MKVVAENSEDDLRKRATRKDFDSALEAASINLLRVIAGAGKPENVLRELNDCLLAAASFREAHGYYPDAHRIAALLDAGRHDEQRRQSWSPEDRKRWDSDGSTMRVDAAIAVRRASLRVVAGQWAGHRTVLINAESAFVDAVERWCNARDFWLKHVSRPLP